MNIELKLNVPEFASKLHHLIVGKTGFPWWAQVDSNHRPYAYQAYALTT